MQYPSQHFSAIILKRFSPPRESFRKDCPHAIEAMTGHIL